MIQRRDFITLLGGAAAWPVAARAQQATMPLVGLLDFGSAEPFLATAFRQGLNDVGYFEHHNVVIEYRRADNRPDRLANLAADLVRRHPAVIVATTGNAALATMAATTSIPIVFGVGFDPVEAGLVKSLNRPGGNATGRYYFTQTLTAKRIGLLRELVPSARQLAVLLNSSASVEATEAVRTEAQTAAAAVGLKVEFFYATTSREIDSAFVEIAKKRADALLGFRPN